MNLSPLDDSTKETVAVPNPYLQSVGVSSKRDGSIGTSVVDSM